MRDKANGACEESVTEVLLLADTPAEENQEVVRATAALLDAASEAKLVAVICRHVESNKPATILCGMYQDEENPEMAQYVPLAMLFTESNAPWAAYQPPAAAVVLTEELTDPLTVFSEEAVDDKPESEETA